MGLIEDSSIAVQALGVAIVATAIAAAVTADRYLKTYPTDTADHGQSTTVYTAVVFIQFFSVATTLLTAGYVGATYVQSRHRELSKKAKKLTTASLERIKKTSFQRSVQHRKRLTFATFAFFMCWMVPALVMCFQGWLYRYKKQGSGTTIVTVCSDSKKTATCDALFGVGIATLVESIWQASLLGVCSVTLMSKQPDGDREHIAQRTKWAKERDELTAKWNGVKKDFAAAEEMLKKTQGMHAQEMERLLNPPKYHTPKYDPPGGFSKHGRPLILWQKGDGQTVPMRAIWSPHGNRGQGKWGPRMSNYPKHRNGADRRGHFVWDPKTNRELPVVAPSSVGSSMDPRP